MKVNGKSVSSASAINDGSECAVSEEERIENLLEMARQIQTDVRPSQYTPLKRACVYIEELRGDLSIAKLRLNAAQRTERHLLDSIEDLSAELEWERRPLWVKIVGWFAR